MKYGRRAATVCLGFTVLTALCSFGAVENRESHSLLRHNDFATVESADAAVIRLVESFDSANDELIQQAGNPDVDKAIRIRAAWALGYLRVSQATPILVRFIDLEADDRGDLGVTRHRWGKYPFAEALLRMNGSALAEIASRLPSERDAHRRELMVRVVYEIDGLERGGFCMNRASTLAKTDEERKNVEAARRLLRSFAEQATTSRSTATQK
jgi:hypothetical protein